MDGGKHIYSLTSDPTQGCLRRPELLLGLPTARFYIYRLSLCIWSYSGPHIPRHPGLRLVLVNHPEATLKSLRAVLIPH